MLLFSSFKKLGIVVFFSNAYLLSGPIVTVTGSPGMNKNLCNEQYTSEPSLKLFGISEIVTSNICRELASLSEIKSTPACNALISSPGTTYTF